MCVVLNSANPCFLGLLALVCKQVEMSMADGYLIEGYLW